MEVAQVPKKYLVKNNTAGWVGVVKLNFRGEEIGEAVEPYGSVWLSELEMQVTARAPRLPEDNPFEEQVLVLQDPQTGQRQEHKVRPLTLVADARRYTPAEDRYVPTVDVPKEAVPAQTREPAVPPATMAAPPTGVPVAEPPPPAVAPPRPGPQVRRAEPLSGTPQPEERQSWLQEPQAPGEVLPGRLDGSDDVPEPPPAERPGPALPDDRFVPSVVGAQAAPQTPGTQEEHAEAVDPAVGEETGQAKPPTGPPEEGEWAWAEEVGAPDAPVHNETEGEG